MSEQEADDRITSIFEASDSDVLYSKLLLKNKTKITLPNIK